MGRSAPGFATSPTARRRRRLRGPRARAAPRATARVAAADRRRRSGSVEAVAWEEVAERLRARRARLRGPHHRPLRGPRPVRAQDHDRGDPRRRATASTSRPTSPRGRASRSSGSRRDLRELLETIQNPQLAALLDRFFGDGLADLGPLPRRAGGEVLPPGLPPRAARAHALGRPGGQRRRRRPSRASTATSRSPARSCTTSARRGLQRRPAGDRPHRRRPPAGRDPARLLPGPPRDRGDPRLRSRARPGGPPHHPLPPRLARARLAGRPRHPRGHPRPHDRQPRRPARQLRPARARAPRRRVLVALRPRP